jgi:hypothetical protein
MRMSARRCIVLSVVSVAVVALVGLSGVRPAAAAASAKPTKLSFNRDIRPILAENCYACHGLDARQRKGKLRLDVRENAIQPAKSGQTAIVPGDLDHSELIARITTDDADDHMPPAETGKKLTAAQIELLRRWVKEGAEYQGLWSLIPPARPEAPEVKQAGWVRNPIDRFVLARLESEGLAPSAEADRATLIRRLYLDLLGLPPTPAEVEAFVKDSTADAYERLVDRLLANPHYGERMALEWLDAARYADTHGYHIDSARDMTAWRDWVIKAFNTNMPFDRFTVEQIAGDLLPNATTEQKIASGFHRNNMVNFEGGAIAEEYLAAYNVDRVNTTGAVWLGLTIGCCQCHDHKYDPLTQKDYYQLYAFFNGLAEKGLDGKNGNAAPTLLLPTADQKAKLDKLSQGISVLDERLAQADPKWDADQVEWEKEELGKTKAKVIDWVPVEAQEMKSSGGATLTALDDKSILVEGVNPPTDTYKLTIQSPLARITAMRIELLPDRNLAAMGPGRSGNGNVVLTEVRVSSMGVKENDEVPFRAAKIKAVKADFSQEKFPVEYAIDGKPETGWAIYPEVGKPHEATFAFEEPIVHPEGSVLSLELDFKSRFTAHTAGRFRVSVTENPRPMRKGLPPVVNDALHIAAEARNDAQRALVRKWFRENEVPEYKFMQQQIAELKKQQADLTAKVQTTQVMGEMAKPRETFILLRGQYDKHGDRVTPNTPAALPPLPEGQPHDRLALAKWLVDPANPLVARVIVNRYWQMYFGIGLVKTAEDFGTQGEYPTHPELLDWLASEFELSHWDVKAMQRLIVTSATYRQASRATPQLVARDPENRLLARGPRFRLAAEFVRDQALAISGLLNDEIGGKSVSPYQPPGLWEELMSRSDGENFTAQTYVQSHGKDLYRRGMYTFWKRTSPPASLSTFDAPDREVCTVRRSRTNTPLQALVVMNDPTYVEAARKLAERVMKEGGKSDEERVGFLVRVALARGPKAGEIAVLKNVLDRQLSAYRAIPQAAGKLLKVGESSRDESLDQAEHAAWTMVCSAVMNLDETVTKN